MARDIDPDLVQIDEIVLSVFPQLKDTAPLSQEEASAKAAQLGLPDPATQRVQPAAAARQALNNDKSLPPWPQDVDPTKVCAARPCPCGSGLKFKQCHGKVM